MRLGVRCLTLDVISDYSWGRSFDSTSSPDMGHALNNAFIGMTKSFWVFRMMPLWMVRSICSMSPEMADKFDKGAAMFARLRKDSVKYITKIRDHPEDVPKTHQTLFYEYLLPDSEKQMKRPITIEMTETGWGVVFAGTETAGFVMEHVILGILSNPELQATLKEQLQETFPEGPDALCWRRLEQIPLQVSCVKEGFRLSSGVMSRLPRVVQEDGIEFYNYKIPRGSIIGATNFLMHRDPEIFPEPNDFRPERWLVPEAKSLEKFFAPFSKGQRQCVGMHLGTCEIYHIIGYLILTENLRLHPQGMQDIKDIEYVDYFVTQPKPGSRSLLVTLS